MKTGTTAIDKERRGWARPSPYQLILTGILLFSGFLLFKNLGDAALWSDEAETAIVAKNFMTSGHFSVWDGRNLLCDRNGAALDENLDIRNPPLQFVLTAASFSLFGVNNFAARFPFALLGLLAILLLYLTLRLEFPDRLPFALYATAFFGLSVEYLLYFRNCRYYAAVCFSALLVFFAWRRFIRRPALAPALLLAGAATLLFYSHPLACIGLLAPLAVAQVAFERKSPAGSWKLLLLAALLFAAAAVPYAVLERIWHRPDMPYILSLRDHLTILCRYLIDSLSSGVTPWTIVLASLALIAVFRRREQPDFSRFIATSFLITVGCVLVIGCIAKQDVSRVRHDGTIADIRYLVAVFPFTAILAGVILSQIHRWNRPAALAVAVLLLSTNIAYCNPFRKTFARSQDGVVYSPLYSYVGEITRHYRTANETASDFLLSHARDGETFSAFPEGRNGPLVFYTGSRLLNSATLDSGTYLGADRAARTSPYLLKSVNFPDWIVFFGMVSDGPDVLGYFSRTVAGSNDDYELAADLPVFCLESNRPEIFRHGFGEVNDLREKYHIIIFHRVPNVPDAWLGSIPGIMSAARILKDKDATFRILTKFSRFYAEDSVTANRMYDRSVIDRLLQRYKQMVLERMPDGTQTNRQQQDGSADHETADRFRSGNAVQNHTTGGNWSEAH